MARHVPDNDGARSDAEMSQKSETNGSGLPAQSKPSDDEENQNDQQSQSKTVGFWHPELKVARNGVFWRWGLTTLTLMVFILAVLSLYWGVFFHIPDNLGTLDVYIVDMDGAPPYDTSGHKPIVGSTVAAIFEEASKHGPTLNFKPASAAQFHNDPVEVRQAVYDWEVWAAVVINPNATALLYSAIESGNKSYDPMGACQLTFVSSRDQTNIYDYILPIMNALLTEAQATFGETWTMMALENVTRPGVMNNLRAAPQAVNPAIGFSQFDLRPFYPYTALPTVSIALIYLIIISFFSYSFYLPINNHLVPATGATLKFWQHLIWRWFATIGSYFFLSCAYSWLSLAFQVNFGGDNPSPSETQATAIEAGNQSAYGNGSFVVYWMLNWVGMAALGLANENMAMVLGQPWTGLWLIFWVISNVCSSFYDVDTEPGFYRWGYAWPMHHVVQGSRQIIFDLHSEIGINFAVLFAWAAINSAVFPIASYFMRWKTQRGIKEYWA